ncbi:ATP-binding protein [Hydrogenivirga sp.]
MREVLKALSVGLVVLDEEGRITFANDFCLDRGIVSEDYEGKRYYEAIRSLELIGFVGELLEGRAKPIRIEHSGKAYRIAPLSGRAFQIEDITELARFERLQKEFAASVSHELSTPITAIKGLLETALLSENPDPELLRKALKRIGDLEKLIKSLRFLVLLETREEINPESFSLRSLVSQVVQDLKEEIEERGLRVELRGDDIQIESDREKLYLLLKNLVENAVKYNREEGKVIIEFRRTPDGVEISIEDTGEGIPREELPLIFQPFFGGRNKKGMGLGLAISKKIADFLGAELRVESEEGKGTRVRVLVRDTELKREPKPAQ